MAANSLKYINFHIPWTKTKENGKDINITDSTCSCGVITALEHHLSSNMAIPVSAPLFMFEMVDIQWSPMKWAWFMARCNAVWEKEGLASIKGHGFHIGGTTHLLLLGVNLWVVMVQGQWSSQAFLSNWHKCEDILCLFIGFSFQSHDSILSTMHVFKAKLTG